MFRSRKSYSVMDDEKEDSEVIRLVVPKVDPYIVTGIIKSDKSHYTKISRNIRIDDYEEVLTIPGRHDDEYTDEVHSDDVHDIHDGRYYWSDSPVYKVDTFDYDLKTSKRI